VSPKLPVVTAAAIIRAFLRHGFFIDRQTGSHVFLRRSYSGGYVCVPRHSGDLAKPTLKSILDQAGIDIPTILEWL
jgi:predicted RNA binding protein YcfA (HicA-like mRNA interferase family)